MEGEWDWLTVAEVQSPVAGCGALARVRQSNLVEVEEGSSVQGGARKEREVRATGGPF